MQTHGEDAQRVNQHSARISAHFCVDVLFFCPGLNWEPVSFCGGRLGGCFHTHKDGVSPGCLQRNILARRIELHQGFQSGPPPARLHGASVVQCAVYHKNGRAFTSRKGVIPVICVWITDFSFPRQLTHLGKRLSLPSRLPRQLCHQQPAWCCCCLIFTSLGNWISAQSASTPLRLPSFKVGFTPSLMLAAFCFINHRLIKPI